MSNQPLYVYVSIGNSDDKLTQQQWASFCADIEAELRSRCVTFHGIWFSRPDSRYQNACWCIEIALDAGVRARLGLARLAAKYHQREIAWVVAQYEGIPAAGTP